MDPENGTRTEDIEELIDILLVEPNPGDTRLFEETFKDAKIMNDIHTVSDGDEALDFVHRRGEYDDAPPPDVVVLEPQLPGTSGMDVLSELSGDPALNEIPVIVLTSSEIGEDVVQSHGLEADEYIRKPVDTEEFVDFVRRVGDFWFAIVKGDGKTGE